MINVVIPGFGTLALAELVLDFNGTLARDGRLLDDARALLPKVSEILDVRVVTADTFGTAQRELAVIGCNIVVLDSADQALAKAALVARIGAERVVAIGNGRNDRLMLAAAALGIGVMGAEGVAGEALPACDVVTRDIGDALGLLLEPRRLVATLRD